MNLDRYYKDSGSSATPGASGNSSQQILYGDYSDIPSGAGDIF